MFRYSPVSPVLLLRHVLLGFNRDELHVPPSDSVYVLNACKFCIRLARNDFRFQSLQPSLVAGVPMVLLRLLLVIL